MSSSVDTKTHSHVIGLGKKGLLAVAILLVAAITLTSWINSGETGDRLLLSGAEKIEGTEHPKMTKPRYHGVDNDNRPFAFAAAQAVQLPDGSVEMAHINADMMLDEDKWLALMADSGLLYPDHDMMEMNNNVQLFIEGGYEFRSDHAIVSLERSEIIGRKPIEGQGPSGLIFANQYHVLNQGDLLKFTHGVKVTLYVE